MCSPYDGNDDAVEWGKVHAGWDLRGTANAWGVFILNAVGGTTKGVCGMDLIPLYFKASSFNIQPFTSFRNPKRPFKLSWQPQLKWLLHPNAFKNAQNICIYRWVNMAPNSRTSSSLFGCRSRRSDRLHQAPSAASSPSCSVLFDVMWRKWLPTPRNYYRTCYT